MKEIPLKQWVADEAEREGVGVSAIYERMSKGKYPNLKRRYKNKRVVFVVNDGKEK